MPDILIRAVDPAVIESLKRRAAENGTSMQAEAKRVLEDSVVLSGPEFAQLARRSRERSGHVTDWDSTAAVREDRDRG
jgi:antitoxin FitA